MSFYTSPLFPLWLQIHLCCLPHLCCRLLILHSRKPTPILVVTEVVPATTSAPTTTGTIAMVGLIFVALLPLLPRTGSRIIGRRANGLLLVDNGLLTDLLSSTSSVNYASPSATQPCNVLSFAAVVISPLPILLLVRFLPLLGSRILVQTSTLLLILRLWPILHHILVMIICMLVMVRVYLYPILAIPPYIPLNAPLHYLMFFMFLTLPNHCYLFRNIVVIIMFILNFTPLCFM